MRQQRIAGFTLIELIIVIALLGILSAIAVPIYRGHIARSHRTSAKAALVTAAQNMERYFSRNNSYNNAGDPPTVGMATTDQVTEFTEGNTYQLSFTDFADTSSADVPATTTFAVRAVPQGSQADDDCGILAIDQAGRRSAFKGGVDKTANCW